jgi:hypothetical protein
MTATAYPVKGMSCQHCVNAVTSELTGIAGVSAPVPAYWGAIGGQSAGSVTTRIGDPAR